MDTLALIPMLPSLSVAYARLSIVVGELGLLYPRGGFGASLHQGLPGIGVYLIVVASIG